MFYSNAFSNDEMLKWCDNLILRLKNHLDKANESIGCKCGLCGAPYFVAFSGKKHYIQLLNAYKSKDKIKTIETGKQTIIPEVI